MAKKTRAIQPHLAKVAVGQANGEGDIRLLDQHVSESLVKSIGLAQNFFYYITQSPNKEGDSVVAYQNAERGYGEIYADNGEFYLKRERAISFRTGMFESPSRQGSFFYFDPNAPVSVTTYVPERYIDVLLSPYSVLCSIESNTPSPVELEDRTLLGRLDGRIQSIDKHELRQLLTDELIVSALSDTQTPINARTGTLNLATEHSTLSSHVVQVKPKYGDLSKPPNPQPGSIIYNSDQKRFEGYDGKRWRPMQWGD